MDEATIGALGRLNREFYECAAAEFSATRRHPWPGWYQIVEALDPKATRAAALRVLDVGCGNGRFALFLSDALDASIRYVGVDASRPLLDEARRALRRLVDFELLRRDLVGETWDASLGDARFDLVAAFGLLHHLPGQSTRRALVEKLARRLAPGGLLAFTIWQFAAFERFRKRMLPWDELPRLAPACAAEIDLAELEPGDHLLRWGPDGARARYCHLVSESEARDLLASLPLECVASYPADGKSGDLNRYTLLRRRS